MSMNAPDPGLDASVVAESIAQMFNASKSELTMIEANLWLRQVERLGNAQVLAFAEFWMSGGAQGSFRRAPTIEDLLTYADPSFLGHAQALELLRKHVSTCGPWSSPEIKDAKLVEAVDHLGGWAKVCEEMPDPGQDFAYKRFADRFKAAWARSEALMVQRSLFPKPLLGLFASPNQLRAELPPPPDALELPSQQTT